MNARLRLTMLCLLAGLALAALALAAGAQAAPEKAPAAAPSAGWQLGPQSPFLFTRFDAEYSLTTGKVYFLGGRLADGNTDGSIWEFDPLTGVYTDMMVDMPTPVSNYTIARLTNANGDEVFVLFGGRPAAGGVTTAVQGYYPGTNTTISFVSDPYPVATSPGGVEVVNNIAYSFGGFNAVVTIPDTYLFDILAPDGSRWTPGPPLTLSRAYINTAVVDGVIYAFGGDTFDGASLIAQTIGEKLDTANPVAWDDASVADAPVACDESRAFGFDSASTFDIVNAVVVAGCGQWPNEITESMIYDVASNTWDVAFPDINEVRRNHAGVLVPVGAGGNGLPGMWIFGGRQGSDATLLNISEYYDLITIEPPEAGFTSNSPVYIGALSIFTNTTTGTPPFDFLWSFGDGVTSTLESPTYTYKTPGDYTVVLTATNSAGFDVAANPYTVMGIPPAASFTSNSPLLLGDTAVFTNTSDPGTPPTDYLWDFGDLITSTLESPTHTYGTTGSFTVTLTASNPYGRDAFSDIFTVNGIPPAVDFSSNTPVYLGETGYFTITLLTGTGPFEYLWDFGDTITSTQEAPTHTYATAGVYTVTLQVESPWGEAQASHPFEVLEQPVTEYKVYLPEVFHTYTAASPTSRREE